MNKFDSFEQFLSTQSTQISVLSFAFFLAVTALLASLLAEIYIRYGKSLSNRKNFASHFILLACTTMLIITIVKSSLALSLGLVGALSIVRFRAAIKEPEELVYLFFNIGIGLGMGAGQLKITLAGFIIMTGILIFRATREKLAPAKNLVLTLSASGAGSLSVEDVVRVLKEHFAHLDLKRFDETKETLEASFFVSYEGYDKLESGKRALRSLAPDLKISFADYGGLVT